MSQFSRNFPQFPRNFPQFSRNFSQLVLTPPPPPDRNSPPPPGRGGANCRITPGPHTQLLGGVRHPRPPQATALMMGFCFGLGEPTVHTV